MAKRTGSSRKWLREHEEDAYVRRARREGLRSRAAYKLLDIQEKHHLIRPGQRIVDLGAAPGGWSQVAAKILAGSGLVYALDLLPMDPLDGVRFIRGDFGEASILEQLENDLGGEPVDLVFSDMAPNLSGMKDVDQPRVVELMELALEFALARLRRGGGFLVKGFQGEGVDAFRATMKAGFDTVRTCKPAASRDRSSEFYLLGTGFRS